MWMLPALLSLRSPHGARRMPLSAHASPLAAHHTLMADGFQVLMGDVWQQASNGGPRVLGKSTLRLDVPEMDDYTPVEKLRLEQEVLGFPLSLNEMELHRETAEAKGAVPSHKLAQYAGRQVAVAGVAAALRRHMCKDGEWMMFITLQDHEGLIETVLFPDAYKEHGETLANCGYGPYLVKGTVQVSGRGRGIGVQLPADLAPTDAMTLKMHPVVIIDGIEAL